MFCGVFTQCSVGYMMGTTFMRVFGAFLAAVLLIVPATAQNQQAPKRKKILAIGEVKGFQHDSVSHALASIEKWGKETGLWDTYIRTDSQLLTKQKIPREMRRTSITSTPSCSIPPANWT